jgi:4-amino-4-deoxy-L-arabinose transferase-like glycosyltransferase
MNLFRTIGPGKAFAILASALAFRTALCILVDPGPGNLFRIHESVAINLLEGDGFSSLVSGTEQEEVPLITYPPGYAVVIAAVYSIAGVSYPAILGLMIALGSLSCLLLAQATALAFGSARLGARAGFALALLPTIAILDVMPDLNATIPLFFLILSLCAWFAAERPRGGMSIILSGLFMGIGSMFRSEMMLLVPAMGLGGMMFSRFRKASVIRAVLFAAGGLAAVSPWAIRNYRVFGVPSPSGPGSGLYLVEMIGKAYPDYENGFAFGDNEILRAEGGTYTDLHWPDPYGRDRERLERALGFVRDHPGRAAWAFARNLPLAWFGHQLYLSRDLGSLQQSINSPGGLADALRRHPFGVLDRAAGMILSLLIMGFGIRGVIRSRGSLGRHFPFLLVACYYFAVFSVIGLLGRYTLPAYAMLLPYAALGVRALPPLPGEGRSKQAGDPGTR